MSERVGFLGLGAMGGPMAKNLLNAGHALTVNDLDPQSCELLISKGATWAASAVEVAKLSDVVLTCLPSTKAIEAVMLGESGVLAGTRPGQVIIEMSTNAPELVAMLHRKFAEKGAHFLDAPITGGAIGAAKGRLTVFAGGDAEAFERSKPVLSAFADRMIHVGPSGTGTVTKLVNNCTSQTIYIAIAEMFALGLKAGAQPLALWEALRSGASGRRRTFDGLVDEFMQGCYSPANAALPIFLKDMQLARDLGKDLGVATPFADLAYGEYAEAEARGWRELDGRKTMTLALERVGAQVAVDPAEIARVLRDDPPAASDSKRGTG